MTARIFYKSDDLTLLNCDVTAGLKSLPDKCIQMCVTSPPYFGLRDYEVDGQMGNEPTPEAFTSALVLVFQEVHRVLKDDGVLWLNLGDSYAGSWKGGHSAGILSKNWQPTYPNKGKKYGLKQKDLIGIPWMVAFALRADGWYLRQDIIWHKNTIPESVKDRCTRAHEYIFLLSKSRRYLFNQIKEPSSQRDSRVRNREKTKVNNTPGRSASGGLKVNNYDFRNKRSVWKVNAPPLKELFFASYPEKLIEPCILSGSNPGDIVLDPFFGSGTTGIVALKNHRKCVGIDLNAEYCALAIKRCEKNIQKNIFFAS